MKVNNAALLHLFFRLAVIIIERGLFVVRAVVLFTQRSEIVYLIGCVFVTAIFLPPPF